MNIGLITTNFGFGPVSKLLYMIDEFYDNKNNLFFYGDQYSLDYIKINTKNKNINLIEIDTDLDDKCLNYLYDMDLIINVLNVNILKLWRQDLPKMYFIDSLTWLWNTYQEGYENASKYFVQNYLLDNKDLTKIDNIPNFKIVNPLTTNTINDNFDRKLKKEVLINFSGMNNPYVDIELYVNYCAKNLKIILNILESSYIHFHVAVNKQIEKKLSEIFGHKKNVDIKLYSNEDFLNLVKESELILSTPGITATIEMLVLNRVPLFLLPTNYSQVAIIEKYRKDFNNFYNIQLTDINSKYFVPLDMDEEEGVKLVENNLLNILNKDLLSIEINLQNKIKSFTADRDINSKISTLFPMISTRGQKMIHDSILKDMEEF